MAISSRSNYAYVDGDSKLGEKLRWVFDFAFHQNKEFQQADGVKTISGWYKEAKQYKDEKQQDGDNKHAILSSIANRTINELIKYVKPCYKDSIIKGIGINTHFKEGSAEMNCNVEFVSIKPFVKFVKQANGREAVSATFRFQLNSSVYINKLQIHANSTAAAGKSIDIDRLGVELELTLLQVTMSSMQMPMPVTSLNKPIKLVSKKFEIKNISFHLGRSLTNKNEVETLDSLGSVARQKVQISITCQKCGNQNQSRFSFCNICGTSIQSSCKNCSNTNPTSSAYCSNCGFVLQ